MKHGHSIVVAATASCAVTLLIGGITWAAIPGDGGVISACYGKVGGVVRVIDTAKREKCVAGLELPLSWNQQGVQGLPGVAGANGTDGVDGVDGVSPTVLQLAKGDPNCAAGGAAITAAGKTAYVCSGSDGADGEPFSGTFTSPNGAYSIEVSDTGIVLSHGSKRMIDIAGDDVSIAGGNVSLVADIDADIEVGQDATFEVGRNTSLTTGLTTTLKTFGNTVIDTGVANIKSVAANIDIGASADIEIGGVADVTVGGPAVVRTGGDFIVDSTRNLILQSDEITHVQGGTTATVVSSGTLSLQGSMVGINSGVSSCPHAVRTIDTVIVAGPVGTIVPGSATVCIG